MHNLTGLSALKKRNIQYNKYMKNVEINPRTSQETITISREEYNNLIVQNKELSQKVLWLMETINLNNKKMFGSSSEKTVEEESAQLSIFNEAEEIANIKRPEPELEEVKSHYRKKRTKKDRLPGDFPETSRRLPGDFPEIYRLKLLSTD